MPMSTVEIMSGGRNCAMEIGRRKGRILAVVLMLPILLLVTAALSAQPRQGQILTTEVKGAIGVASTIHVCKVIEDGSKGGAELVLLSMDTPGGLLSATRDLIQCILGSTRPIAVYVAPSGARAASAGTYIAQAAHIAAMAPGTHIGAATPVAMGPPSPLTPPERRRDDDDKKPAQPAPSTAMERKVLNDAIAYLKGLAEMRGRNTEWAEKAVRDAATLTASEALREKVIDVLAVDVDDLIRQLDGRTVQISGKDIQLKTTAAIRVAVEPDWRMRLLHTISDPNVAFILLLLGVYGVLFEFWSPGAIVPGVVGAVSLLLAMTALSVLPLSYGGLALVLLGIGLMIAEAFAPGIGILGVGGFIAFVLGAIFMFDPSQTDFDFRIAWPVIIGAAMTSALVSVAVIASAVRVRRQRPVSGAEELIGLTGRVVSWQGGRGTILVHGENWSATCSTELEVGSQVEVVARQGLVLAVRKL